MLRVAELIIVLDDSYAINFSGRRAPKIPETNLKAGLDLFGRNNFSLPQHHDKDDVIDIMQQLTNDAVMQEDEEDEEELKKKREKEEEEEKERNRLKKEEEMKLLVSKLEELQNPPLSNPPLEIPEYKDAYKVKQII